MGGQEDFVSSLKAIMAAKREELGEPPTPEELLAYRDGLLDPEQRRRIEAKLGVYPDEARALADLAAFPEVEAAPGTPELTDEAIGARWQTFRRQLVEPASETRKPAAAPVDVRRRFTPWWLAAAAIAGLAIGFLTGRASFDVPGTAINVQIAELAPVGEDGTRSGEIAVAMPESSEGLTLILAVEEVGDFPTYAVEVVNAEGASVLTRDGLHPTSLGTFHLSFRREALRPGTYRIHLFGQDAEVRTRVATYELRLLRESEIR